MTVRELAQRHLSPRNLERAKIVFNCWSQLRETFDAPQRFPLPIEELRRVLSGMGVQAGDVLHVHSSASHLGKALTSAGSSAPLPAFAYAQKVVDLLIELVGPDGTITMNTDAIKKPWAFSEANEVFDAASSYTHRGLITSLFQQRKDVVRSVHPIYNVTAWGRRAEELVRDHHLSDPYTMDRHSPWFRLGEAGAKVLLLGCGFESNSLLHLVEQAHADEFPRAVYLNKPCKILYKDRSGETKVMKAMMHAGLPPPDQIERFSAYLQNKYRLYDIRRYPGASIILYKAKEQYEAMLAEMKQGVTWYDPAFSKYGA